jgi:hypothetical protein
MRLFRLTLQRQLQLGADFNSARAHSLSFVQAFDHFDSEKKGHVTMDDLMRLFGSQVSAHALYRREIYWTLVVVHTQT